MRLQTRGCILITWQHDGPLQEPIVDGARIHHTVHVGLPCTEDVALYRGA